MRWWVEENFPNKVKELAAYILSNLFQTKQKKRDFPLSFLLKTFLLFLTFKYIKNFGKPSSFLTKKKKNQQFQ
jgi:hypothetical protein